MTTVNNLAVRRALEDAGIEFIDENGQWAGYPPAQRLAEKAVNAKRFAAELIFLLATDFIDDYGSGPRVRLRKPQRSKQSK